MRSFFGRLLPMFYSIIMRRYANFSVSEFQLMNMTAIYDRGAHIRVISLKTVTVLIRLRLSLPLNFTVLGRTLIQVK